MMKDKSKFIITITLIIILFAVSVYYGYNYYNTQNKLNETLNQMQTIQNELDACKTTLSTTQEELKLEQEKLQAEIEKCTGLNEELSCANESLNATKNDLEIANTTIADLKGEGYKLVYLGDFKITHYCNESYKHICGNGDGLTATGTNVTVGRTIAVDPKIIPYGTKVYIEGYGFRVAEDCGGGVKKNHIDVAVNTHSDAMSMGVKNRGVWILVKNT